VKIEADDVFRPSQRFTAINGEGLSPPRAERILIGILYNHDTVPDVVTLAAELSKSLRRALSFVEAAAIAATDGATFDSEGWFAVSEFDPDRLN
jgi:hypothetical protein